MTSPNSPQQPQLGRSQRPTGDSFPNASLGLPARVRACLFDVDGVLTGTAKLHAAAWKEMFDGSLKGRPEATAVAFLASDAVGDYDAYVDGEARADGTRSFLRSRGIDADLFDTRVDGGSAEKQHLAGKPAPDTYLAAAKVLGVEPDEAAVFEDALSGVAAGRAGSLEFVVGVDRLGPVDELRAHGADQVVTDLAHLMAPEDLA